MKPARFHPEAKSEMIDAAVWYETQQEDLGKRFLTCVQNAINKIEIHPELYPIVEGDAHRCLTKTFPFGVIFRIKPSIIAIVASCTCTDIRVTGRTEDSNKHIHSILNSRALRVSSERVMWDVGI